MNKQRPTTNKEPGWNGKRLREIRKLLGLTQQEMAEALGYTHAFAPQTISRIECGKREAPPLVMRCAELLLEHHQQRPTISFSSN